MGLLEVAVIFSVFIALYNMQQIKITLKQQGYDVNMLTGWLRDYKNFKALVQEESDQKIKVKYQQNLNGLHFSLGGLAVILFLILRDKM